jgi:hypothetical protein
MQASHQATIMKVRDYAFWTVLTCASLVFGHWLRAPQHAVNPLHPPRATFVEKATYWLALWRLAHGAPQMAAPDRQELPDAVVNAAPVRVIGPDGEPLLAHGDGW